MFIFVVPDRDMIENLRKTVYEIRGKREILQAQYASYYIDDGTHNMLFCDNENNFTRAISVAM